MCLFKRDLPTRDTRRTLPKFFCKWLDSRVRHRGSVKNIWVVFILSHYITLFLCQITICFSLYNNFLQFLCESEGKQALVKESNELTTKIMWNHTHVVFTSKTNNISLNFMWNQSTVCFYVKTIWIHWKILSNHFTLYFTLFWFTNFLWNQSIKLICFVFPNFLWNWSDYKRSTSLESSSVLFLVLYC